MSLRIGVVSDTHGLLRRSVLDVLAGTDQIIHAGDIGSKEILDTLATVSPVTAVRGNVDKGEWAGLLPESDVVLLGESYLYVIHDLQQLDLHPWTGGCCGVVSDHTHVPMCEVQDGVLFLNPGSAGPRRFDLPVTLAMVEWSHGRLKGEIVSLSE